jgi:hypothetical protein
MEMMGNLYIPLKENSVSYFHNSCLYTKDLNFSGL